MSISFGTVHLPECPIVVEIFALMQKLWLFLSTSIDSDEFTQETKGERRLQSLSSEQAKMCQQQSIYMPTMCGIEFELQLHLEGFPNEEKEFDAKDS